MRCECGASLVETTTCEQYKIGHMVLVIANIPVFECPLCQAVFYDDEVLNRVDKIISAAKDNVNQEVTLFNFELACATA